MKSFRKASTRHVVMAMALSMTPVLAEEQAFTAKFVTFNIRMPSENDGPNQWKFRKDLVLETIRDLAPDVMGVQEAYASQVKELRDGLPAYRHVGVGRDDGKEAGEHAAVFYNTERFEETASGTFWLSDTPDVVASNTWEAACNRVCTWIELKEKRSGRTLAVYNAHYDHKSLRAKENSSVVIVKEIEKRRNTNMPIVLMGDFNSSRTSPQMAYFLEGEATLQGEVQKSPLTFTLTTPPEIADTSSTFNGWKGRTQGRQIDFILVNAKGHEVKSHAIDRRNKDGRYPSDHYPVVAEIGFP